MRIALVSPYSWSYPGGVTRHVEALAEQFCSAGHYARVLAPFDPPGRRSLLLHRGAEPQPLKAPDYLLSLGRTVGIRANGAISNLSITPCGVATMLKELRSGGYDVVHIHEPVAPAIAWVAADRTRLPLVGTFHAFSDKPFPNAIANLLGARRVLGRLRVRIAVSEAAAWTGRRWFGGEYRIIPNGVHVNPERPLRAAQKPSGDRLRIVFVGQPVKRKGLPVLLRAFETLRAQIPADLVLIGPSPEHVASVLHDRRGIYALGTLDDDAKRRELELADVLCAPSLGGESFGMVLTEAFAAGLPAVASDIAGYRDVVRDGINGLLVPPGDAQALSAALRELSEQPDRRSRMSLVAAADVERFAWPGVSAKIIDAYHDAIKATGPVSPLWRVAQGLGAPAGNNQAARERSAAASRTGRPRPAREPVGKAA
ncbi:MAG: glycosyltransferase family 4 protein [Solirubrobacteraceae bacterium]